MIIIAAILSLFGLGILRYSWGLPKRSGLLNFGGWGLIAASLFAWNINGADRGVALGLCLFIVFALLFIFREAWAGDASAGTIQKNRIVSARNRPHPRMVSLKGIGLFFVNGPILGAIAFAVAMACHEVMLASDAHASDSLVLALFLFPIIWASLVAYSMIGASRLGKLFTFIALPTLSALALITGN